MPEYWNDVTNQNYINEDMYTAHSTGKELNHSAIFRKTRGNT
jgi:hypothetical protein